MRYLSLFTPNAEDMNTPPTQEHMAAMGKLMDEEMKAGRLIATGGLKRADKDSVTINLKGGTFTIDDNAQTDWRKSMGYAILQGETEAEIIEGVKKFLTVTGGGKCELIEITT